jgi:sigma-B regulation protein RsbU (phosphoserine phosphatase)
MVVNLQKTDRDLDLALAAELQAALLPKSCPSSCVHQVAAARNRMCSHVGGDFYDFIRINQDQTALVIGDVVGHGVRASLIMAQIMGYLRSRSRDHARPVRMVTRLNEMLLDLGEKTNSVMSCSAFYMLLDHPTGVGFLVNAGHPRPYLCDRNTCEVVSLGSGDLLLGVERIEPTQMCHTFEPGQRLVLYTDGTVEAANPAADRFGQRRLQDVITAHTQSDADQLADAVFKAVADFRGSAEQEDDETVVVVDRV